MPGKPEKLRPDVSEITFRVMQEAIGEAPKTIPATVARAKKQAKKAREADPRQEKEGCGEMGLTKV